MLSLADALGAGVGPDEIRRAALMSLTPVALCSAVVVANLILVFGEKLAFTLAGLADDNVLAKLLAVMDLDTQVQVPPSEPTPDM